MSLRLLRAGSAALGALILTASAGLAQQPPGADAPPADVRAMASGLTALQHQLAALRSAAELYVERHAQEAEARAAREQALAAYWAAYVAGLKR